MISSSYRNRYVESRLLELATQQGKLAPECRRVIRTGFGRWLERMHLLQPKWETVWPIGNADQKVICVQPIPEIGRAATPPA